MKCRLFVIICFLFLSCQSKTDKSINAHPSLNGTWVVTKCISAEIEDQRVGIDEIKRNLGSIFKVRDSIMSQNFAGYESIDTIAITFKKVKTTDAFEDKNYADYIGYNSDSIILVSTNAAGWLSEFSLLDSVTIGISVDGFLLYLSKIDPYRVGEAEVTSEKLYFYTDSSMRTKFSYHIVKGDTVVVMVQKGDACFVKYSSYFGWVKSDSLKLIPSLII